MRERAAGMPGRCVGPVTEGEPGEGGVGLRRRSENHLRPRGVRNAPQVLGVILHKYKVKGFLSGSVWFTGWGACQHNQKWGTDKEQTYGYQGGEGWWDELGD